MFAYKAADGLELEGVLTLPPGSSGKNLPLVVMPHGGPIGIHDQVGFDWWAQGFASRGYAVFQPNYRGSGGYGAAFREKGYGELGRGMLSDISDGVKALAGAGIVDPKRACIVGASYGGYAALAGVTIQHGLYRCAVAVSGVTDVGAWMGEFGQDQYSPGFRYAQKFFGVSLAKDPALDAISPLKRAQEADAPILLIHGRDDTVVPFVHSLGMSEVLERAGKPVKFVATPGEDHWLSHEATRTQTLEESVAWVEKYNPVNERRGAEP
jgi:dipeptidyl aminopeptidase/acylaminoacyl peptidase